VTRADEVPPEHRKELKSRFVKKSGLSPAQVVLVDNNPENTQRKTFAHSKVILKILSLALQQSHAYILTQLKNLPMAPALPSADPLPNEVNLNNNHFRNGGPVNEHKPQQHQQHQVPIKKNAASDMPSKVNTKETPSELNPPKVTPKIKQVNQNPNLVTCAHAMCSMQNNVGYRFCKGCGKPPSAPAAKLSQPAAQPAKKIQCPGCNHDNPVPYKFCSSCGAQREQPNPNACVHCKHLNQPNFAFCSHCGKKNAASPSGGAPPAGNNVQFNSDYELTGFQ
jgi:hypothetical protein